MKLGRVIAGGLLAGLILNIGEGLLHGVLLSGQTANALTTLGRDPSGSTTGLVMLVLVTFLQGVTGVWLHAATKLPSLVIGLALWFLSAAYSATYLYAGFPGVLPDAVVWWPVAWELVEYPLAMIVGALVIREK
jgi:hypothetical protein